MPRTWDIFCHVVDNYGDIGVSWRLAQRLAAIGGEVRLWVDDLASLRMLCPQADAEAPVQHLGGIAVHRWTARPIDVAPADVCVEAFGCGLPEDYVQAMAARAPRTLWITLEYLSAEPWVRSHHGLASPHPRWPLQRYFFFPGFEPGTGGVLREPDLLDRAAHYGAAERQRFWSAMGCAAPRPASTVVSLFAYPDAPIAALLAHWAGGDEPVTAVVPVGPLATQAAACLGGSEPRAGARLRRGALAVQVLPFVAQPLYDELLWCCDVVFVRGEDSFVRAQWAQRPFIWQIYPQEEKAHLRKLEAFLDLYCAGLPAETAAALRGMWRAWNQVGGGPVTVGSAWDRYRASREALLTRARSWAQQLAGIGELAENLAEFCRRKLK